MSSWAHARAHAQAFVQFRADQASSCAYKLRNSGETLGADGGLVCPCVGGHPVLPPGNCDRSDATPSLSAKLLVSGYLTRLRQT